MSVCTLGLGKKREKHEKKWKNVLAVLVQRLEDILLEGSLKRNAK